MSTFTLLGFSQSPARSNMGIYEDENGSLAVADRYQGISTVIFSTGVEPAGRGKIDAELRRKYVPPDVVRRLARLLDEDPRITP